MKILPSRLAAVTGVLAGAFSLIQTASAQSLTPVGTWDFVLSGGQRGVAHITFNDDFTLEGRVVVTFLPEAKPDPDGDLRGSGGARGPTSTNTTYHFYGSVPLVGVWTFENSRGGIAGMYSEVSVRPAITNYVSFRGKQTSATRLNLAGHHNQRKFQMRGIPQTPLPDLTGRYYLSGRRGPNQYVRVFDLEPDPFAELPNQYRATVVNPLFPSAPNGVALLSGQGHLAVASLEWLGTDEQGENFDDLKLFSLSGAYNVTRGKGTVSGVNELMERVQAKVFKVASPEDEE